MSNKKIGMDVDFIDFLSDFFWPNEIFLGNMALLIRSYYGEMNCQDLTNRSNKGQAEERSH